MRRRILKIAFFAALLPLGAQAASDDQNRSYIQGELRHQFGLKVNVTELSDQQFWAIYLIVTSGNDDGKFRTRQRIKSIIRRGESF